MRGVILAGGKGTRLAPLTSVTNKHLVSVGDLPMIEYPLHTLSQISLNHLHIVTGGEHFQDIAKYFATQHPDLTPAFYYQSKAGGIAQALSLIRGYTNSEPLAVILGDNIFQEDFSQVSEEFLKQGGKGAMLFLKQVPDPTRYGVAEIQGNRIIGIEEKPQNPKSDLAVTGFYIYDPTVFEKIATLEPSARGELEITDVNNLYIEEGNLKYHVLQGFWSDAGTHESREKCTKWVRKGLEKEVKQSLTP